MVLSFLHIDSGYRTQVLELSGKHPYLLSHNVVVIIIILFSDRVTPCNSCYPGIHRDPCHGIKRMYLHPW